MLTLKPMTNHLPCFILCAGEARRFDGVFKQLLPVGAGETFLGRIVRQAGNRARTPIIVTHHEKMFDTFPDVDFLLPIQKRWTCETLLSVIDSQMLQYRNIVLLGDVVYSKDSMDRIFRHQSPVAFWGNEWEIYALMFRQNGLSSLRRAIDAAVAWEGPGKGKLRRVWQVYYGLPQGDAFDKELLEYVGCEDYTRDIDTPDDYKAWLSKSKTRLDDLP